MKLKALLLLALSVGAVDKLSSNLKQTSVVAEASSKGSSTCQSQSLLVSRKGKPLPAVWWLHIPKCGSSFSISADIYPKSKYRSPFPVNNKHPPNAVEHQILRAPSEKQLNEMIPQVVVMLREPTQRLLSSYYYKQKYTSNCCWSDWGWNRNEQAIVLDKIRKHASIASTVGQFVGCQTRMIIGRGCMTSSLPKLSKIDSDKAIERMMKFKFVGILEEWTLSICLFNMAMTGERFIFKSQLNNNRPTKGNTVSKYNVPGNFPTDYYDGLLYTKALARFRRDLLMKNISLATCPIKCG